MTGELLATVMSAARRAADTRERATTPAEFEAAVTARQPRGREFIEALAAPGVRIIAECKRRSPSRGVLVRAYDPVAIARAYESAGAAAVSVLTESTFFDGSLDHLRSVSAGVGIPTLRKDFVVSEFQVREARAAGADAVLLIVAALDPSRLAALLAEAAEHGLAALVEVHDRTDLDQALGAGAMLIGVNSRNLRTLEVDRSVFDWMAPLIPDGVVAVAESGLSSADGLLRLHELRYDAFLVGERLVTAEDPGRALRMLLHRSDGGRKS